MIIIDYELKKMEVPNGYSVFKSFPIIYNISKDESMLYYLHDTDLYIVYTKISLLTRANGVNTPLGNSIDVNKRGKITEYLFKNGKFFYIPHKIKNIKSMHIIDELLQYCMNEQNIAYEDLTIINAKLISDQILKIYKKIYYYILNKGDTKKGGNTMYGSYILRPICARSHCVI